MAYDLFGNGKTAFKVQLGRYVSKLGTDLTEALNPIGTSVTSVTVDGTTTPRLDDPRSKQLRPRLQSRELRDQRRVRRHQQQQLR